MRILIICLVFSFLIIGCSTTASNPSSTVQPKESLATHEYAPIEPVSIAYDYWTYQDLKTGEFVRVEDLVEGSKMIMLVYYAPWCENWQNQRPVVDRLNDKYRDLGLRVIGISEYASKSLAEHEFGDLRPSYTVVVESESRDDRESTAHFRYRRTAGDQRKWGSPWNLLFETTEFLSEKEFRNAWVVNGELIEKEIDIFLEAVLSFNP